MVVAIRFAVFAQFAPCVDHLHFYFFSSVGKWMMAAPGDALDDLFGVTGQLDQPTRAATSSIDLDDLFADLAPAAQTQQPATPEQPERKSGWNPFDDASPPGNVDAVQSPVDGRGCSQCGAIKPAGKFG